MSADLPEGLPPIPAGQLRDLWEQFAEAVDDGSSNDACQILDDFFTANGWPTAMYRERPKGRRRSRRG